MPFSYIQDTPDALDDTASNASFSSSARDGTNTRDIFSTSVHFQMPQLMLGPTLALGGGAEVLPTGLLPTTDAFTASWSATSAVASLFPPQISPPAYPLASTYETSCKSASDYGFLPAIAPTQALLTPSPRGLPVYSTSGFDLLSILARVASRPNPKIVLGPVDMSCAFIVTDVRRFDNPVVYASPTFYRLTGYTEDEVLGRNCRFLQNPDGQVNKGDDRTDTSPEAVSLLWNSVNANKECQTSLINYRKGGAAFVNLVTIIPVPGGVNNTPEEADDYIYHVGFQVDLTEQPNAILNRLRDGTYILDYSNQGHPGAGLATRDWRTNSALMSGASKELRAMLTDPAFTTSIPLALGTTSLSPATLANSTSERTPSDPYDGNKLLHLLLLQMVPGDFVHVVSLKGAFLYVAPSVKNVLGYEPEELVGKYVSEFCHPADVVPLMRELKESSTAANAAATAATLASTSIIGSNSTSSDLPTSSSTGSHSSNQNASGMAKVVDLLFRMKAKSANGSGYVWLESRGRLHIEPGKGRKAIILSGRLRRMPMLDWGLVTRNISPSLPSPATADPVVSSTSTTREGEVGTAENTDFWGLLSRHGTFLFVGSAIRYVLGWGAGEVIGRPIVDLVPSSPSTQTSQPQSITESQLQKQALEQTLLSVQNDLRYETQVVDCEMGKKDGGQVSVRVLFFRPSAIQDSSSSSNALSGSWAELNNSCGPIVCHVRVASPLSSQQPQMGSRSRKSTEDVFAEIEPTKDTSWQYELQQLKYANQRLVEEVREFEEELGIEPRYGDLSPSASGSSMNGSDDGGNRSVSSGHAGREESRRESAGKGEPVALLHRYDIDFPPSSSTGISSDFPFDNPLSGWSRQSQSQQQMQIHAQRQSHMPVSMSMPLSNTQSQPHMQQMPYHMSQSHPRPLSRPPSSHQHQHARTYTQLPRLSSRHVSQPQSHYPHSQYQHGGYSHQQHYSPPHPQSQVEEQDRRRVQTHSYSSLPLKRPWDSTSDGG
ncbi:unnamed protein product [Somion occarium]|uniref:PAS domain-containing protein n=1 Tax=Somion occarium TaxID=3059160 RepID=A0ABP1CW01_9APHY